MSNFAAIVAENRRLEILRALEQDADYSLNDALILQVLAMVGLAASGDLIRTDLAWLEEQGLVTLERLPGLLVVKATQRGVDAAKGLARVPGVARPRPEA